MAAEGERGGAGTASEAARARARARAHRQSGVAHALHQPLEDVCKVLRLGRLAAAEDGACELAVHPAGARAQEAARALELGQHVQLEHGLQRGTVAVALGERVVQRADGEEGAVLEAGERRVGRTLRASERRRARGDDAVQAVLGALLRERRE